MNWPLFQNSLLVALGATALSLLLGTAVALWLLTLGRTGRGLVLAGAITAFALPPFLAANCWLDLLGPTGRWLPWLPLSIMSLPGAVWMLALMHWPLTTGFVWSAWRRVEREALEIDPLLRGAALWRWILWPTARGAFQGAAATTFVLTLNQFTIPGLLQVKVFPAELWISFNTTFDYWTALRLGWPMIAVALVVLWAMSSRLDPRGTRWQGKPASFHLHHERLGRPLRAASTFLGAVALGFSVMLPLGHLVLAPLTWKELLPALEAGKAALGWSVGLAAGAAALVVVLRLIPSPLRAESARVRGEATPVEAAYPLTPALSPDGGEGDRFKSRMFDFGKLNPRSLLPLLPWLLFLIPGVVLGIGLIWGLNRPATGWFYDGIGIVILAWGLRYSGPGWAVISAALSRADRRMVELVRTEGGSRWSVFRFAVWPQIASATAVSAFVVFLFCLWDVEALVLIVPPGVETLALRIFNLLHYGHNSQVNALCLILLFVALAPLFAFAAIKALQGGREAT
jgi:iron(III) transport system permease protein